MARARPAVSRARCGIISSRSRMPAVRKPRYSEDVCLSMSSLPVTSVNAATAARAEKESTPNGGVRGAVSPGPITHGPEGVWLDAWRIDGVSTSCSHPTGSWCPAKPRYPSPRGGQPHAHAPRSQPSPALHTEQGPTAELIAEETITALHRSGQRVEVKAGVGRRYPIGDSKGAAPVSLSGLQERLHDVHGASSLQALCLAASLLRQLLTHFVQDG